MVIIAKTTLGTRTNPDLVGSVQAKSDGVDATTITGPVTAVNSVITKGWKVFAEAD
jgi:hypothetical protein